MSEHYIYGSSRLGQVSREQDVEQPRKNETLSQHTHLGSGYLITFTRGNKLFETANHLGTVNMTLSDRHIPYASGTNVGYYRADMLSAEDFTPFGMQIQGKIWNGGGGGVYRYKFNGKERMYEINGKYNQYDYGMRIYDNRLGRFLSVDPLTKKFSMLTPYQYASNSPIDGIDLDGLEYLSFHKSMYRMHYRVATSNTVVNTVYENIPAAIQDAKTRSFKYVGTGPVTANGRDYDPNIDGPGYIPAGKYYQKGPKFYGLANGGQDPEPTSSTSGMGGGAIYQGRSNAANMAAGALGEEGAGVVSNLYHATFDNVRGALNKEYDLKQGFYKATKMVDYYMANKNIGNNELSGGSDRAMLVNFLTDGYLPTGSTEKLLTVAYHGLQIMNQQGIEIRDETKTAVQDIYNKYRAEGGKNKFEGIDKLIAKPKE